jgi:anaerobic magnesium-protoporphyrin IX monomethyl ester cyclase
MADSKGRILFLYPDTEGDGGIPNGMALLSGSLKDAGFETACFDTTFLYSQPKTHLYRQKHGGIMKADHEKFWGEWSPDLPAKIPELFLKKIEEFKPDLIAVSIVDVSYRYAISLLSVIKKQVKIPVVAGGTTVSMCPDMVLSNDCIDVICIGEGEDPLVELAECIVEKKDYSGIRNLWVKNGERIVKNPLRPLKDMDTLSFQDWSIFDERHYYKPYCGSFYRTGFFELARGCHFNCSFCCTASYRKLYHGLGKFVRTRSIDKAFDEIEEIRDRCKLELIFFIDDNFLGMPRERFDYFCRQYQKRIGLPFYIQTRSEVVTDEYVKRLKEINISTIAIGIEHGDEELRKKMNRFMGNEELARAFEIVHKYGIRSTANIIIGMPYEEESMFKETVKLLRKIKPKSISINYFQPYRGTVMRENAVKLGYISPDHIIGDSNVCIDMPLFSRQKQVYFYENFKRYIDGELELDGVC